MSITKLPHNGNLLAIDTFGRITFFGITVSGRQFRPVNDPSNGRPWADVTKGWEANDHRVTTIISRMVSANYRSTRDAAEEGSEPSQQYRLSVSPATGASLLMSKVITPYDFMLATETTVEVDGKKFDALEVPLPSKATGPDKEPGDTEDPEGTIGATWRRNAGIHLIRISPAYTGTEIVWVDQA